MEHNKEWTFYPDTPIHWIKTPKEALCGSGWLQGVMGYPADVTCPQCIEIMKSLGLFTICPMCGGYHELDDCELLFPTSI
jgi:hypothetical protein